VHAALRRAWHTTLPTGGLVAGGAAHAAEDSGILPGTAVVTPAAPALVGPGVLLRRAPVVLV
jgi:hypothetical protein